VTLHPVSTSSLTNSLHTRFALLAVNKLIQVKEQSSGLNLSPAQQPQCPLTLVECSLNISHKKHCFIPFCTVYCIVCRV
jgi:hypothetical protein